MVSLSCRIKTSYYIMLHFFGHFRNWSLQPITSFSGEDSLEYPPRNYVHFGQFHTARLTSNANTRCQCRKWCALYVARRTARWRSLCGMGVWCIWISYVSSYPVTDQELMFAFLEPKPRLFSNHNHLFEPKLNQTLPGSRSEWSYRQRVFGSDALLNEEYWDYFCNTE